MELNTVVSEIKGKVGIITLNRPKALNAVSEEMLRELTSQTKAFDEDPWGQGDYHPRQRQSLRRRN